MRSAAPSARAWSHHRHRRGEPGGDRRAARPGARDPAPGRIPEAAAAALSRSLARAGQRRSRHHLRSAPARRPAGLGMLVVEGDRSFYLFSGSRREEKGEPKRYAVCAADGDDAPRAASGPRSTTWANAQTLAPPDHPWYGVGLFKKGFGGRPVVWAAPGTSWSTGPCTACADRRRLAGTARRAIARLRPRTDEPAAQPAARPTDRRDRAGAGHRPAGGRGPRPGLRLAWSSRARSSSPSPATTSTAMTTCRRQSPTASPGRGGRA